MLIAGSVDGAYRVTDLDGGDASVERVLDAGTVHRVRRFDAVDGVFAATDDGLYRSTDRGDSWRDLGVPARHVYSVAVGPDGERVYAGTRPAAVYVAELGDFDADATEGGDAERRWREREGFQELPSRETWRLPRHENLAQVRDVHVTGADPDRVVAGVEVGGVHESTDGGETWTERRGAVDDDVHELAVVDAETFVAATGFGLYRTDDGGRTWTRLDDAVDQRYFRSAAAVGDDVYAGANMAHTSTWVEPDADAQLFVSRDGGPVEPVATPRPAETVTGLTAGDGTVYAGTHAGTILRDGGEGFAVAGSIPVPEDVVVSYTPLAWLEP